MKSAENILRYGYKNHCKKQKKFWSCTIGTQEFMSNFVTQKVEEWVAEMKILSRIACMDPQSTLSGFTHGLRGRYTYIMRSISRIESLLKPLKDCTRTCLSPVLMERHARNDLNVCCCFCYLRSIVVLVPLIHPAK